MLSLLGTVGEQAPVPYAAILRMYEDTRPCKVSNSLRRLQARELIVYTRGVYTITETGRCVLSEQQET